MTIRRIVRFIAAAVFCAFIAFVTLVIGLLIYEQGDEARAEIAAFIEAFRSGDAGQIIEAVTGAPFALSCFLGPLVFGWLLERKRKRLDSSRHGAKLNREQTAAALPASGD